MIPIAAAVENLDTFDGFDRIATFENLGRWVINSSTRGRPKAPEAPMRRIDGGISLQLYADLQKIITVIERNDP